MTIEQRLESLKSEATKDEQRRARSLVWEQMRTYIDDGEHWRNANLFAREGEVYPSIPLAWMVIDIAVPKVLNRSLTPTIVPESRRNRYMPAESGFVKAKKAAGLVDKSDTEAAAEMMTAAVRYYSERLRLTAQVRQAVRYAGMLGEYWAVTGYDSGAPTFDLLPPDDVFFDPGARSIADLEWVMYRVKKPVEWLRREYPEARIDGDVDDRKFLECWYVRDYTVAEFEERSVAQDVDELQRARSDGWQDFPVYAPDEQGKAAVVRWDLARKTEGPAYPGGWRKIERVDGAVVWKEDPDPRRAPRRLPVHRFAWEPLEGCLHGRGIAELAVDSNRILDSLLQAAVEDVLQGGPVNIWSASSIQAISESSTTGRTKNFTASGSGGVPLVSIPPTETAQSIPALVGIVRELVEVTTGQVDPRTSVMLSRDPSGALIREMEQGSLDRLGPVQDAVREFLRDVVASWVWTLSTYDDEPGIYRMDDAMVEFSPAEVAQAMAGDFRVEIGDSGTIPHDPVKRGQFLVQLTDAMVGKPKPLRDYQVRALQLPNESELIALFDEIEKLTAKPPQPPEAQDPLAAKAAEAAIKVRQRAGEEIADSLGQLSDSNGAMNTAAFLGLAAISAGDRPEDVVKELLGASANVGAPGAGV